MRRSALTAVLAVGCFFALSGVASAHAGFVSSTPEPGTTLGTAPGVVTLGFSEPLNTTLSRARVMAPDGASFQGRVIGADQIAVAMTTNAQGVYEVDWATVSLVDGHTLHGSFRFGVGVSVAAGEAGGVTSGPAAGDLLIAAARVVEDLALLLAVGLLLLGWLSRRDPRLEWVRTIPAATLGVALVGSLAVVAGEALAAAPGASIGPVVSYLTTGVPGVARLARPGLVLVAWLIILWRPRWAWLPLSLVFVALAAAGHAAAVRPAWWGISIESAHLITTGMWAGGILALALQRPPGGWRGGEGPVLLGRFTPVALGAFAGSALTGILRAVQELGGLRALVTSSYGEVLLLKVLLVGLMVQLSVLAWKRVLARPRIEAGVAVAVVIAAALLAAFPLPPGRLAESEARETSLPVASALPKPGDLTLGGDAGQFLIGLTIRPSTHQLMVFVRGPEGDPATAARAVAVSVNGSAIPVSQCAPTCRAATAALKSGDVVDVTIDGSGGGTARFDVPSLTAPHADELLAGAVARMHALRSLRQDEMLTAGGPTIRSTYAMVSPHSMEAHARQPGSGSDIVWIGDARYLRQLPGGAWQVERGYALTVPIFVWDSFPPYIDARLIGHDTVDGVSTSVVVFWAGDEGTPVWFRLWIDKTGLVRKAQMRAEGHFMNERYFAFDSSIRISPPADASATPTESSSGTAGG